MPTALTHALAGLALGEVLAPGPMPAAYHVLTAALGLLPDLDAVGFRLGIPYGSRFGHRGFSHSLLCAAAVALAASAALAAPLASPWWWLGGAFFAVVAGHGALDALTDGGMGVAFFSPLDDRRYFFPWRPIRVSPIGLAAFSRWGLRALLSEVAWVWLPLAALVLAAVWLRGLR
jgi:inner membrane protein